MILRFAAATIASLSLASAEITEIGNDPNSVTGGVDGWSSIMVVDEQASYTNTSGINQTVTPVGFDFQVGNNRGRVTPFLVKVNGNNNFTVLAIGTTRVSGTDYNSTGVFEFDFGTNPPSFSLAPGEKIAPGMTNANPNGSGNAGSVIPYKNGNEIWLTGGSSPGNAGSITVGQAPNQGPSTLDLARTYAFSIDADIMPEALAPPTDIIYTGAQPLTGLPSGVTLGSFSAIDPDPGDTHTFSLVTNPGTAYAISGNELLTNAPASTQTLRVRALDAGGNDFEKDFTFTLEAQSPPTDLTLDATEVNALASAGAVVGTLSGIDPNAADQFTFALVSGTGDGDNSLFNVVGDELRLAASVPNGRTSLNLRLRVTDLGSSSVEKSLTLTVVDPHVLINEFLASNSGGLVDEDGDTSDWIELFNPTDSAINLQGWYLTDDDENLTLWEFPSIEILPNAYLVVFASGKDRTGPELHTNFKLSASGDYLALIAPGGSTIIDDIDGNVSQHAGVSYSKQGFHEPTPDAVNGPAFASALDEVSFDQPRGSYPAAFNLTLTSPAGSQIRYTLDGSKPTLSSGTLYSGSFTVSPSTSSSTRGLRTVRAIAFGGSGLRTPVATHTYLFVADAVTQSNLSSAITSDPTYGPLLDDALLAHSVISITTSTGGLPSGSEMESSIEMFDPSGQEEGFQIDCGIQVVGGHSVSSPKNNFRLYFRSQYGASRLDYPLFADHPYSPGQATSFDRLNLRSGSHDSFFWLASPSNPGNSGGPIKGDALYLRNRWMNDMQFRMGQPALHGRWVQVFVNGAYRGHYHFLEHPNTDFQASYLGGDESDYEFTNGANASKTGSDNWQAIWSQVKSAGNTGGNTARDWIDFDNLADYMILNFYAGNPWDWNPNQNWLTAGPNQAGQGGWKFYSWDADITFQDPGANVLSKNVPDGLFQSIINDSEFEVAFRDRVYEHCFHGGVLTPAQAQAPLDLRAAEIETSIVAETARWQGSAVSSPWDRDGEWDNELNRMRTTFFPNRHTTLLNQLRTRGWYPTEAPEYGLRGGAVTSGYQPTLSGSGVIHVTTDGSDPRTSGTSQIFTPGSITITAPTQVRARSLSSGEWSAVNVANFIIAGTVPADSTNLAVTEVHYNPIGSDDTEFLEFQNVGLVPIDLTDVTLTGAVIYTFPGSTVLQPGEIILVTEDTTAFTDRYLDPASAYYFATANVIGQWSGALANSGETLIVTAADANLIANVTWDGSGRSDGEGSSLEFILDDSRPSREYHGSPGRIGAGPDNRIVFNEVLLAPTPTIELYNRSATSIEITNWLLTDDLSVPAKHVFPATTSIANGAYSVLTNLFPLDSSLGSELTLLEADASGNPLSFVDKVSFGAVASGESFGRWPNGEGSLYPMVSQTFGFANNASGNIVRSGPLVIREIHYNPVDINDEFEFVEIWNSGLISQSLDNWTLRGEADYNFPPGITLASGESIIVTRGDPGSFGILTSIPIYGPWEAGDKLNNSGGEVRLQRAGALVTPGNGDPAFYPMYIEDEVNYENSTPWPNAPDGTGASLRRIDAAIYGDVATNWYAETTPLSGMDFTDWSTATGNNNLLTFALGENPDTILDPDTLIFSHNLRPGTSGVTTTVEVSNDLQSWQPLTTPVSTTLEKITVQVNPLLTNPVFVRVKIAEE